jgi:hypothetical protein
MRDSNILYIVTCLLAVLVSACGDSADPDGTTAASSASDEPQSDINLFVDTAPTCIPENEVVHDGLLCCDGLTMRHVDDAVVCLQHESLDPDKDNNDETPGGDNDPDHPQYDIPFTNAPDAYPVVVNACDADHVMKEYLRTEQYASIGDANAIKASCVPNHPNGGMDDTQGYDKLVEVSRPVFGLDARCNGSNEVLVGFRVLYATQYKSYFVAGLCNNVMQLAENHTLATNLASDKMCPNGAAVHQVALQYRLFPDNPQVAEAVDVAFDCVELQ